MAKYTEEMILESVHKLPEYVREYLPNDYGPEGNDYEKAYKNVRSYDDYKVVINKYLLDYYGRKNIFKDFPDTVGVLRPYFHNDFLEDDGFTINFIKANPFKEEDNSMISFLKIVEKEGDGSSYLSAVIISNIRHWFNHGEITDNDIRTYSEALRNKIAYYRNRR